MSVFVLPILFLVCLGVGLLVAIFYTWQISRITLADSNRDESAALHDDREEDGKDDRSRQDITSITAAISEGTAAFLHRQYLYLAVFMIVFAIVIVVGIGAAYNWDSGLLSMIAFLLGGCTSILVLHLTIKISLYSTSRATTSAETSLNAALHTVLKAGLTIGFGLVTVEVVCLTGTVLLLAWMSFRDNVGKDLYTCLAGFALGTSCVALFARVGAGIYSRATQIGVDLVFKNADDVPDDEICNPSIMAHQTSHHVSSLAGPVSDMMASFAEATCACLIITDQISDLSDNSGAQIFPLMITTVAILTCLVSVTILNQFSVVEDKDEVESTLKRQWIVAAMLMTGVLYLLVWQCLPAVMSLSAKHTKVKYWHVFVCAACGLWSGLIVGFTAEYYTSARYSPVKEAAESCRNGAAPNLLLGLSFGYKSVIGPIFCLVLTIYISFSVAGVFGLCIAALGLLSLLPLGLALDAFAPLSQSTACLAEVAHMGPHVREAVDHLNEAGHTTTAIRKAFAMGVSVVVALAVFGAYARVRELGTVDMLEPFQLAGLLFGAMLPYWFTSMTVQGVGSAPDAILQETNRQFRDIPGLLRSQAQPDYGACVREAADASFYQLVAPAALIVVTPILVGFLFGDDALGGVLLGVLVSGIQMGLLSSNVGGLWGSVEKYIVGGAFGRENGKRSEMHKASVVGDTVGAPLKDISGPSIGVLMKLMAIIALVFARALPDTGYIVRMWEKAFSYYTD